MSKEVCEAVLGFLNAENFDLVMSTTYVALIPKKKHPTSVSEYRPISVCNVLYKIDAKVLANWLKKILSLIIFLPKVLSYLEDL